ncbi:MAG: hypothetical protein M1820_007056 [Bogoriella megaspora]|nr:MAG: hypothetical protein M1820_007056 [Bogoriella megaspora]
MPLPHLPSPPSLFPTYILPSLPFRRRKSSQDSSTSTSSSLSQPPSPISLSGHTSNLQCARCLTDLCLSSQIISKGFTGRHGRAYLVAPPPPTSITSTLTSSDKSKTTSLLNINLHKPVPRQLVTGAHTVCDISCAQCGSVLGWKYVAAEEEAQRYKVGKFILETRKVFKRNCWEDGGEDGEEGGGDGVEELGGVVAERGIGDKRGVVAGEEVEFDSQDEDECEDLFMGIWSPGLARKRRRGRFGR